MNLSAVVLAFVDILAHQVMYTGMQPLFYAKTNPCLSSSSEYCVAIAIWSRICLTFKDEREGKFQLNPGEADSGLRGTGPYAMTEHFAVAPCEA